MVEITELNQLKDFAEQIASKINSGDMILLEGDLGAGKTTFVQQLTQFLNVEGDVNSPTFSLVNIYEGEIPIYHFDFYRLDSESELEEIGYYELSNNDGICCIEWATKFPEALFDHAILLRFSKKDEQRYVESSQWVDIKANYLISE